MNITFLDSINAVSAEQWNRVAGTDYPFTRFEFLAALEDSGAVSRETGWQPQHLIVKDDDELVAVMPLYLKYHSYGEYVFDWSWADAYRRHGMPYYPKLLSAIPYTPSTGPRLCVLEGKDETSIASAVHARLIDYAGDSGASSIHLLFPPRHHSAQLVEENLPARRGVQFHWFNDSFENFDDFLATFSSRKRKNLRKERKAVAAQNLCLEIIEGPDISPELWHHFYNFYQMTYAKRSGHGGYLGQAFFEQVAATMPEHIVLVMAKHEGQYVAGALNFRDSSTLYGRYWGCIQEFDYLHFEACYYQGIEYCIAKGLQRFDPGAQGEHKIQRGFTPVETWSNHWIAHPEFSEAINNFLRQENHAMKGYKADCEEYCRLKKHSRKLARTTQPNSKRVKKVRH